jgi:hydroxyacylglutathione hydrolase
VPLKNYNDFMDIYTEVFGPVETNSYLLIDPETQKAVWIDPAPGSTALLRHLPKGCQIEQIILTHSHWDHIAEIGHPNTHEYQLIDCPIKLHLEDLNNLKNPGTDGLSWPNSIHKPIAKLIHHFQEGDHWSLGEFGFEVMHTPGHSPGSCSFYCKDKALLISGDTLFANGFGRVDFPHSSPKAMKESLKRLSSLPKTTTVLSGHGPQSSLQDMLWLGQRFG